MYLPQIVHVPNPAQQQPHNVNGMIAAAAHWTVHVACNLSTPGLVSSGVTMPINGSYFPQHPPQNMQQKGQHEASAVNAAQSRHVERHVTPLSFASSVTGDTRFFILTVVFYSKKNLNKISLKMIKNVGIVKRNSHHDLVMI